MGVLLILVDGMRPDALADIPAVERLMAESSYALDAKTVFPSVTLPCHMSLFHSVEPSRHGTTTNVYAPQVRPVEGLFEVLKHNALHSAMFYSWEELRDVSRPGSLTESFFRNGHYDSPYEEVGRTVTDRTLACLRAGGADFVFSYLGWPDEAGHESGWMGEEYLRSVRVSWAEIDELLKAVPAGWTVIVTADHGGHDRIHGTTLPEDMTIPIFLRGPDFTPGKAMQGVSILDLAPTIAALLGVKAPQEWEGKSLL